MSLRSGAVAANLKIAGRGVSVMAGDGAVRWSMLWEEVLKRMESGESEETEFKRGLGDMSAVGKALCAFANTRGGLLVLGADDAGRVVGVAEDAGSVGQRLTDFFQNEARIARRLSD